jgi:hypothetical protein
MGIHRRLAWNLSVNKKALRCDDKAMDARRKPQPRVCPWARVATPQTRFVVTTLRAGVPQATGGCRNPLVVMYTTARLAPTPVAWGTPAQGCLIHG